MTLNIWGGHIEEPLLSFLSRQQDVDIICLQEVYHDAADKFANDDKAAKLNILSILKSLLPQHHSIFKPVIGKPSGNAYGICIFLKNNIDIVREGDIFIHYNPNYPAHAPSRQGPFHSRNLQWVECCNNNKIFTVMNVHGLWNGQGKSDAPERLIQSQLIRNFMDKVSTPKILCGDFNLRPETESFKIIKDGMCNLVETFQIQSTRTVLYSKREEQPFADYVLTCPDVLINSFQVLPDIVSDHAPLVLDFAIKCE